MSVFQRGNVWWYTFKIRGQRVQETESTTSKTLAIKAERVRRRELEESVNNVKRNAQPKLFSSCATKFLKNEDGKHEWKSERTIAIQQRAIDYLLPHFGKMLLQDISPKNIKRYQVLRQQQEASGRTINIEIGALRMILRDHKMWERISDDVNMLDENEDVGRSLSDDEVSRLLAACRASSSLSLHLAVLLSLHTALRSLELRSLRWRDVDLIKGTVRVSRSKGRAGLGRIVPLTATALECLRAWRSQFPGAKDEHFIFCSESYWHAGRKGVYGGVAKRHSFDPEKMTGPWKASWVTAKKAAGIECRWHDLRHSSISRIAESAVSDSTIQAVAGWTSPKMLTRYSHVGNQAKRDAVSALEHIGRVEEEKPVVIQ